MVADARPAALTVLELLKPVTWFPPMWAFMCGVVSSGVSPSESWGLILAGIFLAGPLVCGTSQAVNDWFDRHVDAINEPKRPIPSGRMPGSWGLYVAIGWTMFSLLVAMALGMWVFVAALFGLACAWAYSAPPLRLKQNGWWGNSAVALCYEGVPWFTAATVMSGTLPRMHTMVLAVIYSAGAHGIMTLNDFKSVEGDRRMSIGSLPVRLGVSAAAWVACGVMAVAQVAVIALLFSWGRPLHAAGIVALLAIQLAMMARLLRRPQELDYWYNAAGVPLYVIGMLVSAFAVQHLGTGT